MLSITILILTILCVGPLTAGQRYAYESFRDLQHRDFPKYNAIRDHYAYADFCNLNPRDTLPEGKPDANGATATYLRRVATPEALNSMKQIKWYSGTCQAQKCFIRSLPGSSLSFPRSDPPCTRVQDTIDSSRWVHCRSKIVTERRWLQGLCKEDKCMSLMAPAAYTYVRDLKQKGRTCKGAHMNELLCNALYELPPRDLDPKGPEPTGYWPKPDSEASGLMSGG
ncbi:hypothetical protein MMC19_000387 [Ptychographa xylographoides]|nr:hypothetical protein [Ptychographa xylographoides]